MRVRAREKLCVCVCIGVSNDDVSVCSPSWVIRKTQKLYTVSLNHWPFTLFPPHYTSNRTCLSSFVISSDSFFCSLSLFQISLIRSAPQLSFQLVFQQNSALLKFENNYNWILLFPDFEIFQKHIVGIKRQYMTYWRYYKEIIWDNSLVQ